MSPLLLERSPTLQESRERDARRRLDETCFAGITDAHGRLTLDDLISDAWEGLAMRGTVTCPVCAGAMATAPAHDDDPLAGTCLGCGSRLA